MLAEERFSEILKLVNEHKTITVQELTELLDMSESTIRRDLTTLHKKGKLIKVHGGATAVNMAQYTRDESVAVRQDLNIDEKVQIGKYASSLIEKDDFVYIDAGTTTDFLIDFLTEQDAVYVTNGIMHAKKLTQKGCIVYLIGGELKEATLALVGEEAMKTLGRYHFTKGFFGTNGVDKKHGFTTPDPAEAMIKKAAMERCRTCYILADSSKIGQIAPVTFAKFDQAKLITTELTDKDLKKEKNIVEVKA
mgnify:CR=1 FL=1